MFMCLTSHRLGQRSGSRLTAGAFIPLSAPPRLQLTSPRLSIPGTLRCSAGVTGGGRWPMLSQNCLPVRHSSGSDWSDRRPACGDVRRSAAGEVAKYRFRVRALRVGERQTDTGHGCWTSRTGTFQVGVTAAALSWHKTFISQPLSRKAWRDVGAWFSC